MHWHWSTLPLIPLRVDLYCVGNLGYGFARIIDVQLEGEEEAGKMKYSIASVNESLVEKFSYLARLSRFRRGMPLCMCAAIAGGTDSQTWRVCRLSA